MIEKTIFDKYIERFSMLEDKQRDSVTKDGNISNKLPIGLIIEKDGGEEVYRDFDLSESDGNADIILTNERVNNTEKMLTYLLATYVKRIGHLKESEINEDTVRKLTDVDRDYLFTKLRDITFGKKYDEDTDYEPLKASIKCTKCGHTIEIDDFDVSRLYVNKLKTAKDALNFKVITKELGRPFIFRGKETSMFSYRLPTGLINERIAHLQTTNLGLWKNALIKECLLVIGEFPQPFTEEEIKNLPSLVRKRMSDCIIQTKLGVDKTAGANCVKCGYFNKDTRIDFENFFPL